MQIIERKQTYYLSMLGFAGILLLSFLRYYAYRLSTLALTMMFFPASLLVGGLLLAGSDLPKKRGVLSLFLYVFWFFLSILLSEKRYGLFVANQKFFLNLLSMVFFLFPAGYLFGEADYRKAFLIFSSLTVLAVTALSIWGLVCAGSGIYYIPSFGGEYGVGIHPELFRLTVLTYPNTAGLFAAISGILCVILLHATSCRRKRILLLFCVAVIYIAIGLTDSRTSMIAFSLGLACCCFRTVSSSGRIPLPGWKRMLVSIGAALVVLSLSFLLFRPVVRLFNEGIIRSAHAEEVSASDLPTSEEDSAEVPAPNEVVSRDILHQDTVFQLRERIWKIAIESMNADKVSWLIGFSPMEIGPLMGERILENAYLWTSELHNSFMQILAGSGLPALILVLLFLLFLALRCIRLLTVSQPLSDEWICYLPALLLVIVCIAFQESFLFVCDEAQFANVWFFSVAGMVYRAAPSLRSE